MRKFLSFAAALLSICALSAGATEFTAANQYTEGQFDDVSSDSWYAQDVENAYELGFMMGTGANLLSPDAEVKLSEVITTAARMHAIYNDNAVPTNASSGDWYTTYVTYAEQNGIIENGEYTDFTRAATRHEVAEIFASALPADYYEAINEITKIPDVPSTNAYADELLMLYRAGVIMGNDEYGTFKPESNIKRSEMSAIINRAALPEIRLSKTLTDADYEDAYYLLDDTTGLKTGTTSVYNVAWNYDNRNRVLNVSNIPSTFKDTSDTLPITMWRDLDDQDKGLVTLESIFSVTADDGFYFAITDDDKNDLMRFELVNGVYQLNGTDTGFTHTEDQIGLRVEMNLDNDKACLYINGTRYGNEFNLNKNVSAGRIYIGTTDEASGVGFNVTKVVVYRNYLVNEKFDVNSTTKLPADWTTSGFTAIEFGENNYNDAYSAYSNRISAGTSTATKTFNKISGSVVFESYVLLPEANATATVTLKGEDETVASIIIDGSNGKITTADGTELRHHTANIWQTLRIEADTTTGNVTYKINGKNCGTYYSADAPNFADSIEITHTSSGASTMYFDDVEVYLTHEYDDYCPTPVPVTSENYDAVLNMCSLWHEGQHRGWSAISAFADKEPYLGYYDEGLAEVADWEIKYMVEHGIEVQHLCWYAPVEDLSAPIKKSRFNDALHDGFFNAKYSNMMKFTFMWENSIKGAANFDDFKNYIWNYWVEYYFTDPRFYVVDNKPVFTVWSYTNFNNSFGTAQYNDLTGTDAVKAYMNEEIQKYGFDGIIMLFADAGAKNSGPFTAMANYGGDGAYAYHWQQDGVYSANVINRLENNANLNKIHIVPTASVGFNNIGWDETRKPMATVAEHKAQLEYIKEYLLNQDQNSWKSKMLIISTWNEYGEGTYVMPAGVNGFGYLDNVRNVLIDDGADMTQYNVVPTEQQKARLVHMYTGINTPLMHYDELNQSDSSITLMIDNIAYTPSEAIVKAGEEYYVPAEPMKGFFSLHNLYYEWNRYTGRFCIVTQNGKELEFTVGSAEVKVDGVSQQLAKAFELRDGLPMIPYKWLLNIMGNTTFNATADELSVSVIDEQYKSILATRVANEWEFNIPGDIEGWIPTDMDYEVTDGKLIGTTTPNNGVYKATLQKKDLSFDTKHYYKVKIRAKFDTSTSVAVYFTTDRNTSFNEPMSRYVEFSANTYQEFEIDLSTNQQWSGTLTGLRIDPKKYDGDFEIDYIKLVYDETGLTVSPDYNTEEFEIYNGDASDTNSKAFYSNTASVKIISEPGNESNNIFNVTANNGKVWTYFRHKVTYTPGATYNVSFKIKLLGTNDGTTDGVSTNISVNAVYADEEAGSNDHPKANKKVSVADGWVTYTCSFTIPSTVSDDRTKDQFAIYADPVGNFGCNYYIDDVVVTETK